MWRCCQAFELFTNVANIINISCQKSIHQWIIQTNSEFVVIFEVSTYLYSVFEYFFVSRHREQLRCVYVFKQLISILLNRKTQFMKSVCLVVLCKFLPIYEMQRYRLFSDYSMTSMYSELLNLIYFM